MLATLPGSRSFARSNNQQPSDQGLTTTISKVLEVVSGIFLPKNFVQQKNRPFERFSCVVRLTLLQLQLELRLQTCAT